MAMRNA